MKGKGKGHPATGYESPEGEWMYSSTVSLTSTLDGVGGQHHASAALLPGRENRYSLCRRVAGPQGGSGRVRKVLSSPGLDPRTVQTEASRYTDRPIPATNIYIYIYIYIHSMDR
jgi:hypothetical protein